MGNGSAGSSSSQGGSAGGWTQRLDLNYYDFVLNKENIEAFNE